MDMVVYAAYGVNLVSAVVNNTDDILVQFLSPRFVDSRITIFDGEDQMNIYLGIGVCHNALKGSS